MPYRLAIMLSGRGSTMQALAAYAAQAEVNAEIALVIADRNAAGLDRAEALRLDAFKCLPEDYDSPKSHEKAISQAIDNAESDAVFLAGYMRLLSADFCRHYQDRLFNIHPSLLPKHKGLNTHQRALDAGDAEHGCSIHLVTPELDSGTVLLQRRLPVRDDDDAESLAARVLTEEHRLYAMLLGALAHGLLQIKDGHIEMKKGILPGILPGALEGCDESLLWTPP